MQTTQSEIWKMKKKYEGAKKLSSQAKYSLEKQMFRMLYKLTDDLKFSKTENDWPTVADFGFACIKAGLNLSLI